MNKIEFSNGTFTYKILFCKDYGYCIKRFNKLGDLDVGYNNVFETKKEAIRALGKIASDFLIKEGKRI